MENGETRSSGYISRGCNTHSGDLTSHKRNSRSILFGALLMSGCSTVDRTEIAWQALHAVDALQTARIGSSDCFYEKKELTSALIGENPSKAQVATWWIGTAALHALISSQLKNYPTWYRIWQSVTIINTGYHIVHNHNIGVRVFKDSC